MNPAEYWKAIRRRRMDVVLAIVVSVAAGWAITSVAPPGPPVTTHEATAVMVQTGNPFAVGSVSNLEGIAALSTIGEVPERVATALDYEGEPLDLVQQMEIEVLREAGVIRFTATTQKAGEALRLANTFARQTRSFLRDQRTETTVQLSTRLGGELEELQAQIENLDDQIATASPEEAATLQAQRDANVRQYGLVYEQYQSVALSSGDPGGLDLVYATAALPQSSGGLQPPRSPASRLILAAILGLVAGIVIVLALDRFDQRIRTRDGAEKAFGLNVLAEIPFIPRRKRRSTGIVTVTEPRSYAADAFRIVATMLSMDGVVEVGNGNGHGRELGPMGALPPAPAGADALREAPRTILVTSPGPDDGKTTIVANLAAAFAARGKRTVVFSCDLRRPHVHSLFGAENRIGLAEVLQLRDDDEDPVIPVSETKVERVYVVPSGQPPPDPGELLASERMRHALLKFRAQADVVLVDTAPILTTSDAVPLVTNVDAVLIVARSGRTTLETARRTTELLRRLGAPVAGVILNAAAEINLPRRYYYNRYYKQFKEPKRRRGIPGLARHSERKEYSSW